MHTSGRAWRAPAAVIGDHVRLSAQRGSAVGALRGRALSPELQLDECQRDLNRARPGEHHTKRCPSRRRNLSPPALAHTTRHQAVSGDHHERSKAKHDDASREGKNAHGS